jgi:hypothetical protein
VASLLATAPLFHAIMKHRLKITYQKTYGFMKNRNNPQVQRKNLLPATKQKEGELSEHYWLKIASV